jgi:putative nucleotidyltransferase with HDIG domain
VVAEVATAGQVGLRPPASPADNWDVDEVQRRTGGGRRWTEAAAEGRSWRPRPVAAFAVRLVARLLPMVASIASTAVLVRLVPRPAGITAAVLWWAGVFVAASVVLLAVDRAARRLLPLAAMLQLSLAFPDQTPSRLSVALRAGSTSTLERRLDDLRSGQMDGQPAQAATTILSLAASLSAHDRRTRGHSERVRALAEVLGRELHLSGRDLEQLRWAALLHDIGKLQVAQRVLNKPGTPDEAEWRQLRRHPVEGERLVEPLRHWLGPWADAVRDHHERWDGTGYPAGLAGEEISHAGRIVAVADAFETITATRPYKRPLSPEAARAELARSAGTHFDPAIVRAFLGISVRRLRLIMGPLAWLGALPFTGALTEVGVRTSLAGGQLAAAGVSAGTAATGVVTLAATGSVPVAAVTTPPRPVPLMAEHRPADAGVEAPGRSTSATARAAASGSPQGRAAAARARPTPASVSHPEGGRPEGAGAPATRPPPPSPPTTSAPAPTTTTPPPAPPSSGSNSGPGSSNSGPGSSSSGSSNSGGGSDTSGPGGGGGGSGRG